MRLISVPVTSTSPRTGLLGLIRDAQTRLQEFCVEKIIALKLAPKSFNFMFDFHNSRRMCNKSVERVMTLLKRACLKKFPFIEHISPRFWSMSPDKNMCLTLKLDDVCVKGSLTNVQVTDAILSNKQVKLINRYVVYLNYLSRKHAYPISIAVNLRKGPLEGEIDRWNSLTLSQREDPTNFIKYSLEMSVYFKIGTHEYYQWDALPRGDDSEFANESRWGFTLLSDNIGFRRVINDFNEKYYCIERLFLITDQIVKVFATLSRKTEYVYSAFNISPAENPRS